MTDKKRIRELNDHLRQTHKSGKVCLTIGIQCLSQETIIDLMAEIAHFDNFTEDNDPWKEHDCATMEHEGRKIIWKIDYYDKNLEFGSEDPANPEVTTRVMTVMLASEY